ncbi:DnaJ homolog subfamily B member 13 [Linum perenne]
MWFLCPCIVVVCFEVLQLVEEVKDDKMNGIHNLGYDTTDNPSATSPNGIFKQKTKDDFLRTITSPLSKITSKRCPSPCPKPSTSSSSFSKSATHRSVPPLAFVHKCINGLKTSATDPDHPLPATAPSSLSRDTSQRSTTTTSSNSINKVASSLLRDTSQRSNASTTTAAASSSVLSRNASERSTTPIMFSNSTGRKVKPPPVYKNLECTLEDLFYGCTKKVKVTRDVLTDRGQIVKEEEILSIQVKPGWRKGTKITFEGMGNERPGTEAADVTFVIMEKRHSLFQREGDDLEIALEIPLVQALTGCDISIPLMSETGETMNLMIQDVIYPGYKKVILGQGMPKSKQVNMRGNLQVTFTVEFPTELTEEQRSHAVSILEGSS